MAIEHFLYYQHMMVYSDVMEDVIEVENDQTQGNNIISKIIILYIIIKHDVRTDISTKLIHG